MSAGDVMVGALNAELVLGGHPILWREIVGNAFGLASAVGGMRRRVWAWPVGIVGNVLLFTVFLGAAFATPQGHNLLGQASRQVMFAVVAGYGWWRWRRSRSSGTAAVDPRWATWPERAVLVAVAVAGVAVLTPVFRALGSYEPVWSDAWIFTGSLLATYAMARGWVDFWLVWIGVDVVGVPLLVKAQLYPSAVLYAVYAGFVVWGFTVWWRITRDRPSASAPVPTPEEVGW